MNINNPKIWTITDGSQGMISQTKGLAFELSNDVIEIKTDVIFPWSKIQPGILPTYEWIFKNKVSSNLPDIIISCGRKSVYLSTFLKNKFSNIINIHIQNPKISTENFSYVVAPNHDNFTGKNVINSVGALHSFKNNKYSKKNLNTKKENLVSCIIGGENNHYAFGLKEAFKISKMVKELKEKNLEIELLVISSRRTSNEIKNILKNELSSIAKLWIGEGENPYEFALYNSDFFIITSDSTSMISEASISGMPIYIYQLPYKRKSVRFENFHDEFKKLNITRDFKSTNTLEKWSYPEIDESKRIAGIIKKRIIKEVNESITT